MRSRESGSHGVRCYRVRTASVCAVVLPSLLTTCPRTRPKDAKTRRPGRGPDKPFLAFQSGEGGIRTPGTPKAHNGFRDRRIKPALPPLHAALATRSHRRVPRRPWGILADAPAERQGYGVGSSILMKTLNEDSCLCAVDATPDHGGARTAHDRASDAPARALPREPGVEWNGASYGSRDRRYHTKRLPGAAGPHGAAPTAQRVCDSRNSASVVLPDVAAAGVQGFR